MERRNFFKAGALSVGALIAIAKGEASPSPPEFDTTHLPSVCPECGDESLCYCNVHPDYDIPIVLAECTMCPWSENFIMLEGKDPETK